MATIPITLDGFFFVYSRLDYYIYPIARVVSSEICVVTTTLPGAWKEFEVGAFCHEMVESGVACAQYHPVTSMYKWNGEMNSDKEWKIILKLSKGKLESILEILSNKHPYDLPQITYWVSSSSPEYSDWVNDS